VAEQTEKAKVKSYTDLVADTKELYDGYTAPEEILERVRDAWWRAFSSSGLVSLAGELNKSHQESEDRWILGWIVGEDECYYYIVFDPTQNKVFTEQRGKAKKDGQAGTEGS
jgi:hypothetical protein